MTVDRALVPSIGWCTDDLVAAQGGGFDYAECGLRNVATMAPPAFSQLLLARTELGFETPVANVFLPPDLPITGPDIDTTAQYEYVSRALTRAQLLGVGLIALGSAKSRRVPPDFSLAAAFDQLVAFGSVVSEMASGRGIEIAVEPFARGDCNLILRLHEGIQLAEAVGRKNFNVMVDLYHWAEEGDDLASVVAAGPRLRHVHISCPRGRRFPGPGDGYDYGPFFAALAKIRYQGRVSIEARPPVGGSEEMRRSIDFLREQLASAGTERSQVMDPR